MRLRRATSTLMVVAVSMACAGAAAAQLDTAFTYQGKLSENGAPANGAYNFQVSLWDALLGGNQIGSTMQLDNWAVTDGLFTLGLDFGASIFGDTGRYLQITVNGTTLNPRHVVTRTPYAIQTRGIHVNEDKSFTGIGRTSQVTSAEVFGLYKNTSSYGGMYIETSSQSGRPFYGYSAGGDADAYHYLDGATGNLNFANPGVIRMTIASSGRVGIGTDTPDSDTQFHVVTASSDVAIFGHAGAPTSNPIGVYGLANHDNGWGVAGEAIATSGFTAGVHGTSHSPNGAGVFAINRADDDGIGVWGRSSGAIGRGVLGESTALTGAGIGVRGYCASTSGYDFYAAGPGINYGSSSSIRWKNNIVNIPQPLDLLAQLRGVYFDWDEEHGGHHDVGMIAEEVGALMPEIVNYEANGIDAQGMDYSKLTPLLVEAMNALRAEKDAEITALRQEIDELRTTLGEMRAVLEEKQ